MRIAPAPQPAPAPAPASETKQEIKEEDAPMEVDESSAAKKPRVSSDADAPMEGSSLEEVSSGQPGSSSRPPKADGSPMGEGSARRPKPSTRQPKVEGSSLEEESTPPPPMEPTTEEAEKKVRQGVWGDTTTTLLPDAFELLVWECFHLEGISSFMLKKLMTFNLDLSWIV